MNWFIFTGTNPNNPSDYTLVASSPVCPFPTQKLCAIQATNDGNNQPIITCELKSEIILALNNETNTTNVKLKAR